MMRVVVPTDPGVLELNWTFLPTFIGSNTMLKKEIEQELSKQLVGKPWSEETFDFAHDIVLDFLEKKFPVLRGLREYLDSIKYVADR